MRVRLIGEVLRLEFLLMETQGPVLQSHIALFAASTLARHQLLRDGNTWDSQIGLRNEDCGNPGVLRYEC